MSALPDLSSIYTVTSAGIAFQAANKITQNPRVLLAPPGKRGSNLAVPRADGVVGMPHKLGAATDSLRMIFIGDVTRAGAVAANPAKQLLEELHWFEENVYLAATDTEGTVALSVTGPGGFARVGRVQWLSFEWGDADTSTGLTTCRAALRFEIPRRLSAPVVP